MAKETRDGGVLIMTLTPLNAKYAKCQKPVLVWSTYQFGQGTALTIKDEDGESIAIASVNIGSMPAGCIAVKNYSENEGILDWLIENKIVDKPSCIILSGFVCIPVCKLLVEPE